MRFRIQIGTAYALALIILQTFVVRAQPYRCLNFPLDFGRAWQYVDSTKTDTLIASVVDTATINGLLYYCYAPYGPFPGWPRYWLRPEPGRVFALNQDDSTEYLLYDFSAQPGDQWPVPPELFPRNVPVNQLDWGTKIVVIQPLDSILIGQRIFYNIPQFYHSEHPGADAGILGTSFAPDIGMVRFSQLTEGGVVDWILDVPPPDTVTYAGVYTIVGNPGTTVPAIPGVVSAVSCSDTLYVLEHHGRWYTNGECSWNGYVPAGGDSVYITGIITDRLDISGNPYRTIEIIDLLHIVPTSIPDAAGSSWAATYELSQNHPNPFNPATVIGFTVAAPSAGPNPTLSEGSRAGVEGPTRVRLSIFDLLGREIAVLVNEELPPGTHRAMWYATGMASGLYFYRLEAVSADDPSKRFVDVKKMVLLR